jgi:hypothetical protein
MGPRFMDVLHSNLQVRSKLFGALAAKFCEFSKRLSQLVISWPVLKTQEIPIKMGVPV